LSARCCEERLDLDELALLVLEAELVESLRQSDAQ
jgi:hypothetical protein